jgi:hypothetical protein
MIQFIAFSATGRAEIVPGKNVRAENLKPSALPSSHSCRRSESLSSVVHILRTSLIILAHKEVDGFSKLIYTKCIAEQILIYCVCGC